MTFDLKPVQGPDLPSRTPAQAPLPLKRSTPSPRADWAVLDRVIGVAPALTHLGADTLLLVMAGSQRTAALITALERQGLRCSQRSDGLSALMAIGEATWPTAILLAYQLPDANGLKVCASLRHFGFQGPLLMLLQPEQGKARVAALDAGADDVIDPGTEPEEIAARLRAQRRRLVTDRTEMGPSPWRSDPEEIRRPLLPCDPGRRMAANPLTPREQEVLEQMVLGLGNSEIADRLVVSLDTVKTHVRNLMGKLKARHRTQAVIVALQSGYCLLPDCGGMASGPKRVGC